MRSSTKPERIVERRPAIAEEAKRGAPTFTVTTRIVGGNGEAKPKSMCPRGVPLQRASCCPPL